VIEALNRSGRPVLALDLPSGLDADTGRPLGVAVRATATATFVAPKLGFAAPGAEASPARSTSSRSASRAGSWSRSGPERD
jgi:NAD(P)H-hydrate repair Nnr-like enzyme with NAD(P)H-hydrate epimerase domain